LPLSVLVWMTATLNSLTNVVERIGRIVCLVLNTSLNEHAGCRRGIGAVGVAPPSCVDLLKETGAGTVTAREIVKGRLLDRGHNRGHHDAPVRLHVLSDSEDHVRVVPLILRDRIALDRNEIRILKVALQNFLRDVP